MFAKTKFGFGFGGSTAGIFLSMPFGLLNCPPSPLEKTKLRKIPAALGEQFRKPKDILRNIPAAEPPRRKKKRPKPKPTLVFANTLERERGREEGGGV